MDQFVFSRGKAACVRRDGPVTVYVPSHADDLRGAAGLLTHPCTLVALSGFDWSADLSPWPALPVMRDAGFAGNGSAFLRALTGEVIPAFEPDGSSARILAGYSLAGLFSLWACTVSDAFDGAASVSGSLWFDGFSDHLRACPARLSAAYLSVGDREKRTKNPRMQRVEAASREAQALLQARGVNSTFELNPGGHFQDPAGRLARGIDWVLGALTLPRS